MNYVFNKGVIWVQTNANPGEGVSTTSFNNQIKSELSLMNFPSVVIFKNLKYLKKIPANILQCNTLGSQPLWAFTICILNFKYFNE